MIGYRLNSGLNSNVKEPSNRNHNLMCGYEYNERFDLNHFSNPP